MFDFDKTYSKEEYENLLNELGVTKYELPANEYKE
jgi:DNA-directed RNA polymerase subunit H (RpoH/RPB5)